MENSMTEVKKEIKEMNCIIADISKSETEIIRVSARDYKGISYVDVRLFFRNQEGEYKPTRKGITVKKEAVSELACALSHAAQSI